MDGLSSTASVIAVIQLTRSLVKLCGGYIQEVKDARDEIFTLQRAIAGLQGTLQDLQKFLQSNDGKALPTSSQLGSNIADCLSDLRGLEERLDPGKAKNLMKRFGFPALRWPLKRTEVQGVVQNLEKYKSSFLLSLQMDQSSLMVGVVHNTDRINHYMDLGNLDGQAKYISRMDKIYMPILIRLLDDQESDESEQQQLLQEFQDIVGVIILLAVPLSINALSLFLEIGADQISNRLDSLRSVLSIPGDRDQPVRILHLSFRDFLVRSSTKFFVHERRKHKEIAHCCLKTMQSHLQKDICGLANPGARKADIDPQHIRQYLPPELRYSCRYWIYHLEKSQDLSSGIEDVLLFLQKHFLHWLEAMSLLGLISEVVGMLDLLHTVIPDDDNSGISDFLHDGTRFVLKSRQIADEAPLQIYCAGLVFAPRSTIIGRQFKSELPSWIYQYPQVNKKWNAELQTLEGHSDWVQSVAFSPDGRLLASGSHDNTVRLWDSATGGVQQTLEGHSDWVQSVAFSPNGRLLASGSHDNTVRLWNTATGGVQQTLEGHSDSVQSMAFSPDGRLLATGSGDKTVRLWDSATGGVQQTLEGHSAWVHSVAFSPDGRLLASGSGDMTVRLWDSATGGLQQTLEGHSAWVQSMVFSPDGRLLASGSGDKTVRLWDTATGGVQQTLEGHSAWVHLVAFSPDGRLLASGSGDNTVRLWDTATGGLQETLTTKGFVNKLDFSQEGSYLITNLGTLDVQSGHENLASNSTQKNPAIFIEQGKWINVNGKNVLWLPHDFRPTCSAINGDSLALGHASGRVSFLGFLL